MKTTIKLIHIIAFLLLSLSSIASNNWKEVTDSLHIERNKIMTSRVLNSIIPFDTTKSMIMVPVQRHDDNLVYDMHLIMINNTNKSVLCHYVDSAKIFTSKKKVISNTKYDFAKFMLTDKVRAFGVRVTDSTSSDIFMAKNEFLSLYTLEGNNIKRVLNNVLISSNNDQWNLQNCEGDHFAETKIIVMSRKKKSKPSDYKDLIIKNRVVTVKNFIKRDTTANDSIANNDSLLIHKQKISKSKSESTISFNDGDVVSLGGTHEMIMHDKLIDIENVNADSLAKMLDDEKTKKENMDGEELDTYKLEQISNNDDECIESTTTEWMREYYVFKKGEYVLTVEPK